MGKETEDKPPDSAHKGRRKRLRENGSQTDEDAEHVALEGRRCCENSTRLDEMNVKLDQVLTACGEINSLKQEICELREDVKSLKESLEFADKEIASLKSDLKKTSATVKDNSEDIESFNVDIEILKRRNIKLEAYTRRENMRIFNVQEESDENTEGLVRNIFTTKMQIPLQDVNAIRFERVHRIPTKKSSQRSQSQPRSNPIIVRFSHYQDKEFVRSFVKNLKGTNIGISDDFPKEVGEIHKTLYPVLKKAKQEHKRAHFKFDKLIIDGHIYRGKETKNLPYYGNIKNNFE